MSLFFNFPDRLLKLTSETTLLKGRAFDLQEAVLLKGENALENQKGKKKRKRKSKGKFLKEAGKREFMP